MHVAPQQGAAGVVLGDEAVPVIEKLRGAGRAAGRLKQPPPRVVDQVGRGRPGGRHQAVLGVVAVRGRTVRAQVAVQIVGVGTAADAGVLVQPVDAVAAAGVGDGAAVVGRVGEAAGDDLRGGVVAERQAQIGGRSGQVVVEARQAGERVIAVGRRRAGARCVRASDLTVVGKGRGTGRATVVE